MTRRGLVLAAALVLAAGISCRDASGPRAGPLRVRITMPAANSGFDGAILFTISGPAAPSSVTVGGSLEVFNQQLAPTTKYAVLGTLATGATILTLNVNDVGQSYTATIQEVAASSGYQLRTLNGYSLSVTR
jgi:hypothetical protein